MGHPCTADAGFPSRPVVIEYRDAPSFVVSREVFVSREIFEREQRAMFDRCWIYLGHASEVAVLDAHEFAAMGSVGFIL